MQSYSIAASVRVAWRGGDPKDYRSQPKQGTTQQGQVFPSSLVCIPPARNPERPTSHEVVLPFVMLISDVSSNAEQEWFGSYEHALSFANVPPGLRPISGSVLNVCAVGRWDVWGARQDPVWSD